MINTLLMKLRPVEGGYDPIRGEYALEYAENEWRIFNPVVVDLLEEKLGGLAGKRVLDLGGGPGQFAVEFARRGAHTTWHDISRNYRTFVQGKAKANGVEVDCSLGYLEEASRFLDQPFDLVFNRICWLYCLNDAGFARLVHGLIRPGGLGYIHNGLDDARTFKPRYWLNACTGLKIGHAMPPPGRLEKLFHAYQDLDLEVLQRSPNSERLLLTKKG